MKSVEMAMGVLLLSGFGWSAQGGEERLRNNSFEFPPLKGQMEAPGKHPAEWHVFSTNPDEVRVGLTSAVARSGRQAMRLKSQGVQGSYQGVFQSLPVEADEVYAFELYVRMDRHQPIKGTERGEMHIELRNQNDEEIKRVLGHEWGKSLSSTKWTRYEMKTKVPEEAVRAHFVVTFLDGVNPLGGEASFLVDDASVEQKR